MARTWLVITVELVSGGDNEKDFWPRPGRTFIAARIHTFEQLAVAIDDTFGRWDLNHLHEFALADGTCVGVPDPDFDEGRVIVDSRRTRLGRLAAGEQFAYIFDLGDYWAHLCTVGPDRTDPVKAYGAAPVRPVAIFGWGNLPDQYGRRWISDDGSIRPPPNPWCGRGSIPSWPRRRGAARSTATGCWRRTTLSTFASAQPPTPAAASPRRHA